MGAIGPLAASIYVEGDGRDTRWPIIDLKAPRMRRTASAAASGTSREASGASV